MTSRWFLDIFLFHQERADLRMRRLQITLGFVMATIHCATLLLVRSQLLHPIGQTLYPALASSGVVAGLIAVKLVIILSSLLVVIRGGWLPSVIVAFAHGGASYVDYQLFPGAWNYNGHLVIFAMLIAVYELARRWFPRQKNDICSVLVAFALVTVGLIYFQAFLAKLNVSGWKWFVTGATIQNYVVTNGTVVGQWLATHDRFAPAAGIGTLIFEAGFLPLVILGRARTLLAIAGIGFHLTIWAVMGISFWHLFVFFPALFFVGPPTDRGVHARAH